MKAFTGPERELLTRIAELIVTRTAGYESEFFHELAAEYWLHPEPPEVPVEPGNDPLAAGLGDF